MWDRVYTEDQAARGAGRYTTTCAGCHGTGLEGYDAKALTGDVFWQGFTQTTVDYLFTYVSENMPQGEKGSLSTAAYLDLTAFILSRNDFPAGTQELTVESAVGIQIIEESGPGELPSATLARVVGCLARDNGSSWLLTSATAPERIQKAAVGDRDASRSLGTRAYPLMFVLTSLEPYVGHRLSVSGLLVGEDGVDGINVTVAESLTESCQ